VEKRRGRFGGTDREETLVQQLKNVNYGEIGSCFFRGGKSQPRRPYKRQETIGVSSSRGGATGRQRPYDCFRGKFPDGERGKSSAMRKLLSKKVKERKGCWGQIYCGGAKDNSDGREETMHHVEQWSIVSSNMEGRE